VFGDISDNSIQASQLLRSVAEQLKLPLTVIARNAELMQLQGVGLDFAGTLQVQARVAMTLVDSYLLGLELAERQEWLALEPVSVSSLLAETAHELEVYARQYNVVLEVELGGKYGPVMAHYRGLRAAILSLGSALIAAQPERYRRTLVLAAHRTPHGISAGVYGDFDGLNRREWRRALELQGVSQRPLAALTADKAAGLFVADMILKAMETSLRVGSYRHRTGLATTLHPSQQLAFV
jgi:hypothetical protein